MTEIIDHGQIAYMRLPPGWVEVEVRRGDFERASLREFKLLNENGNQIADMSLCLYYRGFPMLDERSVEAFRRTMSLPAHYLEKPEIISLKEVLDDLVYDEELDDKEHFKISNAYTADFPNRRILIVEGHWIADNFDMLKLFIDTSGNGRFAQEIYFFANPELYQIHQPGICEMFCATQWKALES